MSMETGKGEAKILTSAEENLALSENVLSQVGCILGEPQKPKAEEGKLSVTNPLVSIQQLLDGTRKNLLAISEKLKDINMRIW